MSGLVPLAAVGVAGVVGLGWRSWARLAEPEPAAGFRTYRSWAIRGLAFPILLWAVFNSGMVPGLPSLSTDIEIAWASGGSRFGALLESVAGVALIATGYWVAITWGWILTVIARDLADGSDLVVLGILFAVPAAPAVWLSLHYGGWAALGWAAAAWLVPTVHYGLGLERKRKATPSYARALAKLQFRKYAAAEQEVIQQLERCQDDFEGWMMLADLYANHFGDLLEADLTIRELCEQPDLAGVQVSLAFHRLADWYLKLADDPVGAREALQTIGHKLPGSHFARMAQQRIDQLPHSREDLREQRAPKPLRLPALQDPLDDSRAAPAPPSDPAEAARQANRWVKRLEQNPNDVAAREQFAVLLAQQLQKVDLGIEQLELLLGMPEQPEDKIAHWLSLIAAWQLKYRQNWEAATPLLERLVRDHPRSPQAFAAQRHLNLRQAELRLRRAESPHPAPSD